MGECGWGREYRPGEQRFMDAGNEAPSEEIPEMQERKRWEIQPHRPEIGVESQQLRKESIYYFFFFFFSLSFSLFLYACVWECVCVCVCAAQVEPSQIEIFIWVSSYRLGRAIWRRVLNWDWKEDRLSTFYIDRAIICAEMVRFHVAIPSMNRIEYLHE